MSKISPCGGKIWQLLRKILGLANNGLFRVEIGRRRWCKHATPSSTSDTLSRGH